MFINIQNTNNITFSL